MAHAQSACCMLLEAAHLTCLQDGLGDFFGLHKSSNCLQLRAKNALVSESKLGHGAIDPAPIRLYRLSAMVFGLCMTAIARGSRCCWLAIQAVSTATEWSVVLHRRP